MKLKWGKYFYEMWGSVLRHIGTAWGTMTTINAASAAGVDVPALNWKAFVIGTIIGPVIPAIGRFLAKTPLPEIEVEETTVTTTQTIKTTKTPEDPDEQP